MREYLDAMDRAASSAPEPASEPRRMLAALGPRMLELAAARSLGARSGRRRMAVFHASPYARALEAVLVASKADLEAAADALSAFAEGFAAVPGALKVFEAPSRSEALAP